MNINPDIMLEDVRFTRHQLFLVRWGAKRLLKEIEDKVAEEGKNSVTAAMVEEQIDDLKHIIKTLDPMFAKKKRRK